MIFCRVMTAMVLSPLMILGGGSFWSLRTLQALSRLLKRPTVNENLQSYLGLRPVGRFSALHADARVIGNHPLA